MSKTGVCLQVVHEGSETEFYSERRPKYIKTEEAGESMQMSFVELVPAVGHWVHLRGLTQWALELCRLSSDPPPWRSRQTSQCKTPQWSQVAHAPVQSPWEDRSLCWWPVWSCAASARLVAPTVTGAKSGLRGIEACDTESNTRFPHSSDPRFLCKNKPYPLCGHNYDNNVVCLNTPAFHQVFYIAHHRLYRNRGR